MLSFVLRAIRYAIATVLVLGVITAALITGGLPKHYEMKEARHALGDLYVRALSRIERTARSLRKDYCRTHAEEPRCAPPSS